MGGRRQRIPALAVAALFFALPWGKTGLCAQDMSCVRTDFVSVVDDAASALRELNTSNKSKFQDRLRDLKTKKGWSQDEYMRSAEPFVRDPKIVEYDKSSAKLLGEIAALGQEGSESATPDCAVLLQLRARMDVLVKTQEEKWGYMFAKIDKALTP